MTTLLLGLFAGFVGGTLSTQVSWITPVAAAPQNITADTVTAAHIVVTRDIKVILSTPSDGTSMLILKNKDGASLEVDQGSDKVPPAISMNIPNSQSNSNYSMYGITFFDRQVEGGVNSFYSTTVGPYALQLQSADKPPSGPTSTASAEFLASSVSFNFLAGGRSIGSTVSGGGLSGTNDDGSWHFPPLSARSPIPIPSGSVSSTPLAPVAPPRS